MQGPILSRSTSSFKLNRQNAFVIQFLTVVLILNVITLLFEIIYFAIGTTHGIWNTFGIILLLTLIMNIVAAVISGKQKLLDYGYLLIAILFMFILPVVNTWASMDISNQTSTSLVSYGLILFLLLYGAHISFWKQHYHKTETFRNFVTFGKPKTSKLKMTLKIICAALLLVFLVSSAYGALIVYQGTESLLGIVLPEYAVFFAIGTLGVAGLIMKLTLNKKLIATVVGLVGIATSVVFLLPLISMPSAIAKADTAYQTAFGTEVVNVVPEEAKDYFLYSPFSLPQYFLGSPTTAYRVDQDVLFYEGTKGVDQGLKLYYDAYMPPADAENLPGNHSVLIRIHGGGWTVGDKGSSNYAEVNKYFANQGYVVFDVQYGLSNKEKFIEAATVPEYRVGDFTIDDMIRHIGLFTTYLADHKEEYGANIDSVFVSGGSAGGQLANAVGLGLASGKYDQLLDSRLKVKGIIPYYPANGLPKEVGINKTEELSNPTLLVTNTSPPALIFQGTHDGIVDPSIAADFNATYKQNDNNSALLEMPYAGHAGDLYYSGYYNQVFMYYMERFMYQYQ